MSVGGVSKRNLGRIMGASSWLFRVIRLVILFVHGWLLTLIRQVLRSTIVTTVVVLSELHGVCLKTGRTELRCLDFLRNSVC